ncbi:MAG: DUF2070 family protein, partial [Promethearchaeota archaeon]
GTPIIISMFSLFFYLIFREPWTFIYFFILAFIYLVMSSVGVLITMFFYSKKSPILGRPPKGWGLQLNLFFTALIGGSFLFGKFMEFLFQNPAFQEIFLMLGTILSYIIAFVIYFSFTTVGKYGNIFLSLIQPVLAIILYSIFTVQFHFEFFLRAMIFFLISAALFAVPYGRSLSHVSKIYKEATGLGGYEFIRAFTLSLITDGNDDRIENMFDRVGITSNIQIQYLFIRTEKTKDLKGLFVIPHVHFGPFKTCGSSDLPEHIYRAFKEIPGITVYHTTNDHAQNLTTQKGVNTILKKIKEDVAQIMKNQKLRWEKEIMNFSRKISNSAKLIGTTIGNIPFIFLTRHPLPSDDIQQEVGREIYHIANSEGFNNIITIDSHNSIIGDEILISKNSVEARDLIDVAKEYLLDKTIQGKKRCQFLYGVAKDPCNEYSEKDGIGFGGITVHLFKNIETNQKTVFIHFDANNAYIEIRSYILNMLQNKGIEKGEITTSDSHTVARQISKRGYSPIGDKIKIDIILNKLEILIQKAQNDLESVEFYYLDSIQENVRIWGDEKYFDIIMTTLQECLRVSQRLLTFSLIIPAFLAFILLFFFYNI